MTKRKVKICARCKEPKGILEFGRKAKNKDGYENYCKDCVNSRRREQRQGIVEAKETDKREQALAADINKRAIFHLIKSHRNEFTRLLRESKEVLDPK